MLFTDYYLVINVCLKTLFRSMFEQPLHLSLTLPFCYYVVGRYYKAKKAEEKFYNTWKMSYGCVAGRM